MEWNYLLEAVVIVWGCRLVYLATRKSCSNPARKLIGQGLTVLVFASVHYLAICKLMGGRPIWHEALFNSWMFLFAVCLGRGLQELWLRIQLTWLRRLTMISLSFVFMGLIFGILNSRRPKIDVGFHPSQYTYNTLETYLPTIDGPRIRTWYIKGPYPTRKLALVAHGLGANLGDAFLFSLLFLQEGWDVVTFDWRGHGLSEGHRIEFGESERNDLIAVDQFIQSLAKDYDVKVAFAISMGAGNLIKNFDVLKSSGFHKLILDSPYSDLREAIILRLDFLPIPKSVKSLIAELVCLLVAPVLNYQTVLRPPLSLVANLEGSDVLLIHGKKDKVIPYTCSQSLHEALPGSKLSLYERADHLQSLVQERARYKDELIEFLAR